MKDFDNDPNERRAARIADRDFKIGGLPFRLRASRDVPIDALDRWREIWRRMIDPRDEAGVSDPDFLAAFYDLMANVLEPDQFEPFREICEPGGTADPITMEDAVDLVMWATGVVGGRPIGASSASSTGSTTPTTAPGGSSSTETSSSPAPAGSIV
jgi:hypothetical protein